VHLQLENKPNYLGDKMFWRRRLEAERSLKPQQAAGSHLPLSITICSANSFDQRGIPVRGIQV